MRRVFTLLACALSAWGVQAKSTCFVLHEIRLEGRDANQFAWITDRAGRYLRQCVGNEDLKAMTSEITGELIARGFVATRIALPPQNLSEGVLRLALRSTHVNSVKMIDKKTGDIDHAWGTHRNAFQGVEGSLLNIRDIEQGLEQMQRLPSQEVTSTIAPAGDEADGIALSDIFIERSPTSLLDRLHGSASLDNSGSHELGRTRTGLGATLENPFGVNDLISLNVSSGAENPTASRREQDASLSYSVPLGYSLFRLSTAYGRFAKYVSLTDMRVLASGSSQSVSGQIEHVVWRDGQDKVTVRGALSMRSARSFIEDEELLTQRRRTTSAEVGIHWSSAKGGRSFETDLAFRQGVSFNAEADFDRTQSTMTNRPSMILFDAGYSDDFELMHAKLRYATSIRARYTPDTTMAIDQFAIGGRDTVRGFSGENNLLAENGVASRNEIALPVELPRADWAHVYLALDMGMVRGPSDNFLSGKSLVGTAVGLRSKWQKLQFDLALAAPLYRPKQFEKNRWSVYGSASYSF